MISIVLTIFNKESLIGWVLNSILDNITEVTKEIIFVFDGCTDRSEEVVRAIMQSQTIDRQYHYANNVFEVIANNIGLRHATQPYCMIIQDDMVIQERGFDKRLLVPFFEFDDIFAVSGRTAHDNVIVNGRLEHINLSGRETDLDKLTFSVRDSCNRGPLLLKRDVLQKLNYLDEMFAPLHLDDHDLCMRAWETYKLVSGAYVIDYRSDYDWGSSHSSKVAALSNLSWHNNADIVKQRHYATLTGPKHSEDRECPRKTQA